MGLREVIIKNFALIKYMDIEFGPGLNVITGETGAGKTLVLKAIEFALGARADTKYIKGKERGSVTLLMDPHPLLVNKWDIDIGEDVIVKREIDPSGRTRMYVNGEPMPQTKVRELFFNIFEFHGQFSNTSLFTRAYMTALYDAFLGEEVLRLKDSIRENLENFKKLKKELEDLLKADYREEIRYIEEQIREFESIGIGELSEEKLKEEEKLLKNAREILQGITFSYDLLYENDTSVSSLLALVERELRRISTYSNKIEGFIDRVESLIVEVGDLSQELYDFREGLEINEDRLNEIEETLSRLYLLKRKYRVKELTDIVTYIEDLKRRLNILYEKEKKVKEIEEKLKVLENRLIELSEELTRKRRGPYEKIEREIEKSIRELGIPHAKFNIRFVENNRGEEFSVGEKVIHITENGREEIEFLFSANPDRSPDALSKIASGGEISRIMLAVKSVLFHKDSTEKILLFDEIDQGIGERLGNVIGERLKSLASNSQVIVITHLSQIARQADNHIFVNKEFSNGKTSITAKVISGPERERELLRMLGGEKHISMLRRG